MIYTILSLLVLAVAYVWVFSPLGTSERVGITTAISMVALVILTSIYAWHTRRMAEEMREQRMAAKPILIPDIDFEKRTHDSVMKSIAQSDFPVVVTNVGTQAAIEIEVTMKGPDGKIGNFYKLPLLLPGATWKSIFAYVNEFDESGEPIFGLPPSEGLYELRVTFKPATSENELFSEVSLPFEVRWSGKAYYYDIKRSGLNIRLQE